MPSLTIEEIELFSKFTTSTFVETGTCIGDTVNAVKDIFENIISIELHPELARISTERFKNNAHISIYQGDSSILLEPICKLLK